MTTLPLQPPVASPLAPPVLPAQSPLTPAHYAQLAAANQQSKKLRRATAIAGTDAWLAAIFAGLTLVCSVFSFSLPAFLLGLALAAVAFNSFRGLRLLRQFDPRAAKLLALNQLFLAAAITLYALACIYSAAHGPNPFAAYAAADPQLGDMLAPYEHIAWTLTLTLYVALIAGTLVFQGLTALYYYTRGRHLVAYRDSTPQWIRDLQAATPR